MQVHEVGVAGSLVQEAQPLSLAEATRRGEECYQKLYNQKYPGLRSTLQSLSKPFDAWTIDFTGGHLFSRKGLCT